MTTKKFLFLTKKMALFDKNLNFIFENYKDLNISIIRKFRKKFVNRKKIDIKLLYEVAKTLNLSLNDFFEKDFHKINMLSDIEIKFLVTDVDGVLTDGGVYIDQNQQESKKFCVKDGFAIRELAQKGFQVGFISAGFNPDIVRKRAEMLGVQFYYVGKEPKIDILRQWCQQLQIDLKNVAYIGDDFLDLEVIKSVGISACPSDASKIVKKEVDFVLPHKGGKAAVRYFIDELLPNFI